MNLTGVWTFNLIGYTYRFYAPIFFFFLQKLGEIIQLCVLYVHEIY